MKRSHGGHGHGPADFSAGLNPLGPPSALLRALRTSGDDVTRYPYELRSRLRRRLAARHGLDEDRVLVTAGASGALLRLRGRFRGSTIQVPVPTYTEYEDGLGTEIEVDTSLRWPRDGSGAEGMLDGFDPDRCRALLLCNPNNPTGGVLRNETLMAAADRARGRDAHLIVDEAYAGFARDPRRISMTGRVGQCDNVWVVRSLTKLYGVPGLRVGYLLTPPGEARRMRGRGSPWPVGAPALRVALAALDEVRFRRRTRRFMARERHRVGDRLRAMRGLRPLPTAVNFYLCQGPPGLFRRLKARGWTVRDASGFTGLGSGWIRFSLQHPERTDGLLKALRTLLLEHAGGEAFP